jgi:hypothetical protein
MDEPPKLRSLPGELTAIIFSPPFVVQRLKRSTPDNFENNSPDGAVNEENASSPFQLTVSGGALLPFGEQITTAHRLCW